MDCAGVGFCELGFTGYLLPVTCFLYSFSSTCRGPLSRPPTLMRKAIVLPLLTTWRLHESVTHTTGVVIIRLPLMTVCLPIVRTLRTVSRGGPMTGAENRELNMLLPATAKALFRRLLTLRLFLWVPPVQLRTLCLTLVKDSVL